MLYRGLYSTSSTWFQASARDLGTHALQTRWPSACAVATGQRGGAPATEPADVSHDLSVLCVALSKALEAGMERCLQNSWPG